MTHLACEQLALRQQVLGFLELMSRRKLPPQPSSYRGAISCLPGGAEWGGVAPFIREKVGGQPHGSPEVLRFL